MEQLGGDWARSSLSTSPQEQAPSTLDPVPHSFGFWECLQFTAALHTELHWLLTVWAAPMLINHFSYYACVGRHFPHRAEFAEQG